MDEFIRQNYRFINSSIEILAAVTGLLFYKKYKLTAAKYFIYFLVYLTICDFISLYTRFVRPDRFLSFFIGTVFEKNHWWSTLYWKIGAILFFGFYYYIILKVKRFRNIIKLGSFIFLVFSLIYIILNWDDFFVRFFPIISILGAVIILMCTVFYFIEILQSDKILTFYRSINFYISLAIFIWWLIITPIVFFDIYYVYDIKNSFSDWDFVALRGQIYLFANMFMYLTYTFALIWCKLEND
ncbi:hypothetical protein Q4Q35_14455 [Flavivirga aquimarina]|uniref:Uncharacterized protein n=1 Tax=Flavivirga aquimarina TaxID=2027862 RepID=A0ABT8WDB3_9FLAO|nr:hypothetical protein [Flavivirga aquimarina]MDO5971006.1 hypothetical protein [Flavivirga aquimarina]